MKPAPATPTRLMTTKQTTGSTSDLQDQIRRRAFELYEEPMAMTWPIGCKPSRR